MNYELCKKLKEAGFIFPIADGSNHGEEITPSLSELIEACGDDFFRLSHSKNVDGTEWDAESWRVGEIETGKTPEIAVANLYLAINKKL